MCEADPDAHPQQMQGDPVIEKELELCKQFLAEAQDDVQQLQAQLATAKQTASAAANSNSSLQQQLQEARQQHNQLQQKMSNAAQSAEAQLAAANTQVAATKQQLSEAKQALIAMQKAMRELQSQQQQQGEQCAALADESSSKHAALKAQATAGAHCQAAKFLVWTADGKVCLAWRASNFYSTGSVHDLPKTVYGRKGPSRKCCLPIHSPVPAVLCRPSCTDVRNPAKAELKRVQAASEQHAAVMAAELAAARTAGVSGRAEASKARSAHASCSCQLAEAQQELAQVRTLDSHAWHAH